MSSSIRPGLIGFCLACLLAWAGSPAHAAPQPVVVGTYVNKIQALDFKGNRYTLDMFIWFRWQATGALKAFRPLESVELVNGFVENSFVETVLESLSRGEVARWKPAPGRRPVV